ncbi:hypothetical protein GCM10020216_098850 [Nonomuraea helvata]
MRHANTRALPPRGSAPSTPRTTPLAPLAAPTRCLVTGWACWSPPETRSLHSPASTPLPSALTRSPAGNTAVRRDSRLGRVADGRDRVITFDQEAAALSLTDGG